MTRVTPESVSLLGVPVHPIDYRVATDLVRQWIQTRSQASSYIVQTNVLSLVTAKDSPVYHETLEHSGLSVPDGMPLVWLLRRHGKSIKDRVYGPELMIRLCRIAEEEGWRCALVGGRPEILKQLTRRLIDRFPRLQIVYSYSPPFRKMSDDEDAEMCKNINLARPDILWVGLGSPKQDIWMYGHRMRLTVPAMHGVGAAFDFLAGSVAQAPQWMMDAGLEWLFRFYAEPRRLWRRYTIVNIRFLWLLLRDEIHHWRSPIRSQKNSITSK